MSLVSRLINDRISLRTKIAAKEEPLLINQATKAILDCLYSALSADFRSELIPELTDDLVSQYAEKLLGQVSKSKELLLKTTNPKPQQVIELSTQEGVLSTYLYDAIPDIEIVEFLENDCTDITNVSQLIARVKDQFQDKGTLRMSVVRRLVLQVKGV